MEDLVTAPSVVLLLSTRRVVVAVVLLIIVLRGGHGVFMVVIRAPCFVLSGGTMIVAASHGVVQPAARRFQCTLGLPRLELLHPFLGLSCLTAFLGSPTSLCLLLLASVFCFLFLRLVRWVVAT